MKPKIFICSPLKAENATGIINNIDDAEFAARFFALNSFDEAKHGFIPVIPHQIAYYLNDEIPEERQLGIDIATILLFECDYIAINLTGDISEGMKNEIQLARDSLIKEITFIIEDGKIKI